MNHNEVTENQARRAESGLMLARLVGLTRSRDLTNEQRIGACVAVRILESRVAELTRREEAGK